MSKVTIIAVSIAFTTLIGFITTLSVWNHNLSSENAELKEAISNYATLLDVQNKALEKQKLDTQAYKKQASEARERIITRYQTIPVKPAPQGASECEIELEMIRQTLAVFYARGER